MSNSQILGERARILADQLLAVPTTVYQQRSLQAALHLFLDTGTKTALHRAPLVSKSAVSRLLNNYDWDTAACWALLQRSQWEALLLAARRKRRACLRLSVDLTSIEKTGKQLPFVRVYNEVHGIHLVVLFAEYRGLKFPVGYRVYREKGTATPVSLALELLGEVPDAIRKRFRIRVLADSGFEAAVFLDGVRTLGFAFVVGVRATRRTTHPGQVTVADCEHGAWLELQNWPHDTLTLARVERGERTFFSVASELMTGDEVAAEGGKRWNIESFFKEGKHQFSLQQFALRTARGLDRWVLLVFLAFTLTMLHRSPDLSLEEAAGLALTLALPFLRLNVIFARLATDEEFLRQHGYSLKIARCNS
ncbi:transposase, IS4 family [Deinococcus geothermalis DSM 11300]|uniref:Transposase, IS4 family n=1 Tax=Deinococcus geothermalis (strain DSM 11300 / CIP 105573 / AG-3a) TaxID=319795 RepID=Q1IXN7_DEIGD|nr:IS701-like element ISDge5 family transposase [Deinococcus geothermalis]ABF45997.1 transposase, IS4 family [Deinococcus geothermalis DSM 11300]